MTPNQMPRRAPIPAPGRIRLRSLIVVAALCGPWLFQPAPADAAEKAAAPATEAEGVEFFERHIRPVLVDHCYSCHSAKAEKVKGGLLLDTRAGLAKGGDSGPAIVPGDPDKSLLIKAVRYSDKDLKMPPKDQKLSELQIEHLETWVRLGAPDPRTGTAQAKPSPADAGKKHWAFQPVRRPDAPKIRANPNSATPVDAFLLARLEEKKLTFTPRADRRTLIRRVTFDLTGLPPTFAEVQAFVGDPDSDDTAFRRVVDRLLASPRYGERWGRYWLDIARYADTKGYVFEEERRYPFSYTYRDYVIRAFNDDLPYDRFLIEQIAADRLSLGDDKRSLAAMGFLTLGRRFLNNQTDIIDDRLDVIGRGTMGLTIGCARCHDHKSDPLSMRDYYGLYGVFASSGEPREKPLLGTASLPKEYPAYAEERKKREDEHRGYRRQKEDDVYKLVRGQVGDYLLALHDSGKAGDDKRENLVRERKLQPSLARHFRKAVTAWAETPGPVFAPWFALAKLDGTNFPAAAAEWIARPEPSGTNPVNRAVLAALQGSPSPKSLRDVAQAYNRMFAEVDREWRDAQDKAPTPGHLPDPDREALRQVLFGSGSPIAALTSDELTGFMDTPAQQKLRALQRKIDELDATHPGVPPRAMAMADNASPTAPRIFRRGNPNNPGDEVPRAFIEVLAGPDRRPFTNGSGRLELAQAIAHRNNPLTARVWVNRVWTYHMGTPLVRTPSDFGVKTEPPTHPELLDYLAARFMDDGWSVKQLHRLILLSQVYQQGNADNARAIKADPNNTLYWRQNRRRLDFEAMRDTLLAASGQLDLAMGGQPVDITRDDAPPRRTIYAYIERQNLPGLFRTFDFASPDTTSPQRFVTTVPQQALFLMNSPFVVQQATNLMRRPDLLNVEDVTERVTRLHQIVFQRNPDSDELALAQRFVAAQATSQPNPEPPTWRYGYGRFDPQSGSVRDFQPLPHWTGYAWQGGDKLPDATLGWILLTGDGGHVGNDQNHAAIRRWRAPADGTIAIEGELRHPSDKGDGVRGRVVSNRSGLLGEWTAQHGHVDANLKSIQVQAGEFIDFVADCRQSVEFDSFHWAPTVKWVSGTPAATGDERPVREWNAKSDFSGPVKRVERRPLSAWEKYAQVLLVANETFFVD